MTGRVASTEYLLRPPKLEVLFSQLEPLTQAVEQQDSTNRETIRKLGERSADSARRSQVHAHTEDFARAILVVESVLAAGVAALMIFIDVEELLFPLAFVLGGLTLPLYGIAAAHANDDLRPEQMVAASSALVLVFGLGAATGPMLVSFAMDAYGGAGFFGVLIGAHLLLGGYGLYRMTQRESVPESSKSEFMPMPLGVTVQPEALELGREFAETPELGADS